MPNSTLIGPANSKLTVPDFIVIGAQRSGSSWLYRMLRQHPKLWLPPMKELFFFCTLWEGARHNGRYPERRKRLNRQSLVILQEIVHLRKRRVRHLYPSCDVQFVFRYLLKDKSLNDYQSLFAPAKSRGLVCGEVTPTYSVLDEASIQTIRSLNPNVKAILTLRDPVERTWSQAMKNLCRGKSVKASDISVEAYLEYLNQPLVLQLSDYSTMIKRWRQGLASGNLLISFYDEIESDPVAFLGTILKFIGVDDSEVSRFHGVKSVVNAAAKPLGSKIPERVKEHLVSRYEPLMKEMAHEFGSIPSQWLQRYTAS